MSTIHGNWNVEDIKRVIECLDKKTGLNGSSVRICLCKSLGKGNTLGSYHPSLGKDKSWRSFSFSAAYFNDSNFGDLAAINCIRRIYAHFVVDELSLKDVFDDEEDYGIAWKTVCGLLNADPDEYFRYWRFRRTTEKRIVEATMCGDIPSVDILEQIERWGVDLPSLRYREHYERELVKKHTKLRVFSINDRVVHNKFGQGVVLYTMPDINKQRLFVRFDNGETRFVQNRQVYKVINGQVKKPASKAR